jgi:uncharacterized protein
VMKFLAVFVIVAIMVAFALVGMALGVLFGRKPIQGSCGGLGNSSQEGSCSLCSNRDSCSESLERSMADASNSIDAEDSNAEDGDAEDGDAEVDDTASGQGATSDQVSPHRWEQPSQGIHQ